MYTALCPDALNPNISHHSQQSVAIQRYPRKLSLTDTATTSSFVHKKMFRGSVLTTPLLKTQVSLSHRQSTYIESVPKNLTQENHSFFDLESDNGPDDLLVITRQPHINADLMSSVISSDDLTSDILSKEANGLNGETALYFIEHIYFHCPHNKIVKVKK